MDEDQIRRERLAQALLTGHDPAVLEGLTDESLEQITLAQRAGNTRPSLRPIAGRQQEAEVVDLPLSIVAAPSGYARLEAEIDAYLVAVSRFEATRAMRIVSQLADRVDIRAFVFGFVLPVMREIGKRWSHADLGVGHEHLATAQLRSCLLARQHLYEHAPNAPRLLATTPAGHRHEFGVLVGALLALGRGFEVIYLGVDLPDKDLLWCVHKCEPQVLLLGTSMGLDKRDRPRLAEVLARVPARTRVWFGGPGDEPLAPGVELFSDFESLDAALFAFQSQVAAAADSSP